MVKTYKKYKKSADIWLGNIPENWTIASLKYFVEILSGYAFKSEDYSDDEGIPIIRIGDISNSVDVRNAKKAKPPNLNELEKFIIKRGDLLLAMTGATIGKNCMYDSDEICYVNQRVGLLRGKGSLSQCFLKYYIDTPLFREFITLTCSGSAQENISASQIGNLQFPLPSIEEQTKITQYLDHQTAIIDQLILQKEKLIELMKEKRKAFINETVTKGLNLNAKMKDSGNEWLGNICVNWSSIKLKWISEIYAGGTPSTNDEKFWSNGSIPWLNSGTVNQKRITEASAFITEDAVKNSSTRWVPKNSLLMALAGQGKTKGTVAILGFDATCNQSMAAIVPNSNKIETEFLFFWLHSNYERIRGLAGSDQRDGLNLEIVGNIICPIPPLEEQKNIAKYLVAYELKYDFVVENILNQIDQVKEYRQSIISEAVTGKIDVRDWQPK
jgi:type I restriction enzyme S subunit